MTTLVKQPLHSELDWIDRPFRRLFGGMPLMPAFMAPVAPAADVYETPEEYVVELEVPGYEEKELGLEISDHTLTVTGSRAETKEEIEKSYQLHERLERTFERTFMLPPEIDGEHVSAAFEKGVLKVHAPKLATVKPRKVAISKS
jgi:HSP20 family protein